MAPFKTHAEIDSSTYSYIQTVTGEKDLTQVPLEDINSFIMGLEAFISVTESDLPTEEDIDAMASFYQS
jgi:hypothetical protein